MPFLIKSLIAIVMLAMCASYAIAQIPQTVGTIAGKVTDDSGNGLANVTITLVGDQTGTQVTHTNASGNYSISYYANNRSLAVTPYKSRYVFDPASVRLSSNINFTGNLTFDFEGTLFPFVIFNIPVLLTEDNSLRVLSLDSVTLLRDPFPVVAQHNLSSDKRTRITLFAVGAELGQGESLSAITVQAESSQQSFSLPVESVRKVPSHDWMTQIVVKLPDGLVSPADFWVKITLRGFASNRVLVRMTP